MYWYRWCTKTGNKQQEQTLLVSRTFFMVWVKHVVLCSVQPIRRVVYRIRGGLKYAVNCEKRGSTDSRTCSMQSIVCQVPGIKYQVCGKIREKEAPPIRVKLQNMLLPLKAGYVLCHLIYRLPHDPGVAQGRSHISSLFCFGIIYRVRLFAVRQWVALR